ncbi:GNAT family protein [Fibrobacter sp. UBA4297]|uniref:GNAT family N-acetyltransferase n=1 Tax=Fibrobacter sp. UBA4297 TaxID=1946536 RepID=UPI0025C60E7A|nr:GNAT family protein [Fibrobacter sp. UBA4297]
MLEGQNVYLRPMEREDMKVYQQMINSAYISDRVVGWSFPVSEAEQNKWFDAVAGDQRNRRFSICKKGSQEAIGMISLSAIDLHNRKATVGLKLSDNCKKGIGIGTDALRIMMKYAIDVVNLHRLEASWLEDNKASEKLYLKCGWKIEGTREAAIFRNGTYVNLVEAGFVP